MNASNKEHRKSAASTLLLVVFAVFLILGLSACTDMPQNTDKNPAVSIAEGALISGGSTVENTDSDFQSETQVKPIGLYDYTDLYMRRHDGENTQYEAFLSGLQIPKAFASKDVDCQYEDGCLKVTLTMNLLEGETYHVDQHAVMQDCIAMFALFDEMQSIEYFFTQNDYRYILAVSRAQADAAFGAELSQFPLTENNFAGEFAQKPEDLSRLNASLYPSRSQLYKDGGLAFCKLNRKQVHCFVTFFIEQIRLSQSDCAVNP